MEAKHTKNLSVKDNHFINEDGRCVGVAYGYVDGTVEDKTYVPTEEAAANAVLWAAAPELLTIAVTLVAISEFVSPEDIVAATSSLVADANAAIAKATGAVTEQST